MTMKPTFNLLLLILVSLCVNLSVQHDVKGGHFTGSFSSSASASKASSFSSSSSATFSGSGLLGTDLNEIGSELKGLVGSLATNGAGAIAASAKTGSAANAGTYSNSGSLANSGSYNDRSGSLGNSGSYSGSDSNSGSYGLSENDKTNYDGSNSGDEQVKKGCCKGPYPGSNDSIHTSIPASAASGASSGPVSEPSCGFGNKNCGSNVGSTGDSYGSITPGASCGFGNKNCEGSQGVSSGSVGIVTPPIPPNSGSSQASSGTYGSGTSTSSGSGAAANTGGSINVIPGEGSIVTGGGLQEGSRGPYESPITSPTPSGSTGSINPGSSISVIPGEGSIVTSGGLQEGSRGSYGGASSSQSPSASAGAGAHTGGTVQVIPGEGSIVTGGTLQEGSRGPTYSSSGTGSLVTSLLPPHQSPISSSGGSTHHGTGAGPSVTGINIYPNRPSSIGGSYGNQGIHTSTGTNNYYGGSNPGTTSKVPCCKGPFPGPIGSIHESKPASSVPLIPNRPSGGSTYYNPSVPSHPISGGNYGSNTGSVGGSHSKGPCCKGPFPGPNGSIHDSIPASSIPTVPNQSGSVHTTNYPSPGIGQNNNYYNHGTAPGTNNNYNHHGTASGTNNQGTTSGSTSGSYGGSKGPCCKGPFPGPIGSIHTSIPASSVPAPGTHAGSKPTFSGTYQPGLQFTSTNKPANFPSGFASYKPAYGSGLQQTTNSYYSGSNSDSQASGSVHVQKPDTELHPPIIGSYKPNTNSDFVFNGNTNVDSSGSLVNLEKKVTTTSYDDISPLPLEKSDSGLSGPSNTAKAGGSYGNSASQGLASSGYATGSVLIHKPDGSISIGKDTLHTSSNSGTKSSGVVLSTTDINNAAPSSDSYGNVVPDRSDGFTTESVLIAKPEKDTTQESSNAALGSNLYENNPSNQGSINGNSKPGDSVPSGNTPEGSYGSSKSGADTDSKNTNVFGTSSSNQGSGDGYATGSVLIHKPDGSSSSGHDIPSSSYGGHISGAGSYGNSGSYGHHHIGTGNSAAYSHANAGASAGSYGGVKGHSGANSFATAGSAAVPGFSGLLNNLFGRSGLGGNLGISTSGSFAKSGAFASSSSFAGSSSGSYSGHY